MEALCPDRIYHILVVDDVPSHVRLLQEILRQWTTRHCLHVADDGEEALDFLSRKGNHDGAPVPDLIFLDLNMPKVDGFDVLKQIRSHPNSEIRSIPVIVPTASDAPSDIERAYALGANCYVTKPCEIGEYERMMAGVERFWFRLSELPWPSLPPICEANDPSRPAG